MCVCIYIYIVLIFHTHSRLHTHMFAICVHTYMHSTYMHAQAWQLSSNDGLSHSTTKVSNYTQNIPTNVHKLVRSLSVFKLPHINSAIVNILTHTHAYTNTCRRVAAYQ